MKDEQCMFCGKDCSAGQCVDVQKLQDRMVVIMTILALMFIGLFIYVISEVFL